MKRREPFWCSWLVLLLMLCVVQGQARAAEKATPEPTSQDGVSQASQKMTWQEYADSLGIDISLGLIRNSPGAYQGYTLLAPMSARETFLIDMEGRVVHQWKSKYVPWFSAKLLENGHLMRTFTKNRKVDSVFDDSRKGGVQEISWRGEVVWEYTPPEQYIFHHDFERLPNGNVLLLTWLKTTSDQMMDLGRDSQWKDYGKLMPDMIIEVKPTGPESGRIVWQWSVLDHVVQGRDASKPNFGRIEENQHKIDLNHVAPRFIDEPANTWTHLNSIEYIPEFDQILVSSRAFNEVWVIDHSTTTKEAAGSSGGHSGRGGDLLYRWGSPSSYAAEAGGPQVFYAQHDASWIPGQNDQPGHVMVFNNGLGRYPKPFSTVDILELPVNEQGLYALNEQGSFGPGTLTRRYSGRGDGFFSPRTSGAQMLPNGNLLVTVGAYGHVIEVTPDDAIVWEYVSPIFMQNKRDRDDRMFDHATGAHTLPVHTRLPNPLFKVYRYPNDFPGFKGRKLSPGLPVEDCLANRRMTDRVRIMNDASGAETDNR